MGYQNFKIGKLWTIFPESPGLQSDRRTFDSQAFSTGVPEHNFGPYIKRHGIKAKWVRRPGQVTGNFCKGEKCWEWDTQVKDLKDVKAVDERARIFAKRICFIVRKVPGGESITGREKRDFK